MNRQLWTTLILGVFVVQCAIAGIVDLSQYDLDNKQEFTDFIFLPKKGSSKQGVFYYLDYEKRLTSPTGFGPGWRSIAIQMYPTAYGAVEYNQFVAENNIIDTRRNLFPQNAVLCSLTHDFQTQLLDLGVYFTTTVLRGGYPKACTIILRYYAEEESELEKSIIDLFLNHAGVAISYSVEVPQEPSITIQFAVVIKALFHDGILEEIAYNQFVGQWKSIVYQASLLSPGLFGANQQDPISSDAWDLFTSEFNVSENGVATVTISDNNQVLIKTKYQEPIINVDILR